MTIEEFNIIHWGHTIVLQGETPLEFAIRREGEENARLGEAELRERTYDFRGLWYF